MEMKRNTKSLIPTNSKSNRDNVAYNGTKISKLFDLQSLDLYCRYVMSENKNIRLSSLELIRRIFNRVDIKDYGNDKDRINRIIFIKRGLDARIDEKLSTRYLIGKYINGGLGSENDVLNPDMFEEISDEVLAYINEESARINQYGFMDSESTELMKILNDYNNSTGPQKASSILDIKDKLSNIVCKFNKIDAAIDSNQSFSTNTDEFFNNFRDVYAQITNPSKILRTGISGLNQMLGGGFEGGRVYIFFGTAATGKSFLAMDLALQIAKYNKDHKTQDLTKRPCIIFLTLENSRNETVNRMFMMLTGKTMNDGNLDQSFSIFAEETKKYNIDENGMVIDIIYKECQTVSTNYLYELVDDAKSKGLEPICVFVDHIKRINSASPTKDLRLDLGNIVNEFKAFANNKDIPVITISHLNREASRTITEAKNKKDIIRTLGSHNVSDSNLLIDNCDAGIFLNREYDSENNMYMGFMQVKIRTKCDLSVFFQPFKPNGIFKLTEDVDSPFPVYKTTLVDPRETKLKNYGSDFNHRQQQVQPTKKIDDEEDDFFSSNELKNDNVLLPRNDNQNQFIITGGPSQPIYQMPLVPSLGQQIMMLNTPQQDLNSQVENMSDWDKHLLELKYTTDIEPCVYFMDENGNKIHDGLEDLRNL